MKLLEQQPRLYAAHRSNIRCEHVIPEPAWAKLNRGPRQCKWAARFEHGGKKLCITHAKNTALMEALKRDL